ncbi:DNA-3-methyladenine glycosylase [Corynebacterium sp. 335C]
MHAALSQSPPEAARALLGARLAVPGDGVVAAIVEVEAYGGPAESPWPDPGAHTWPGRTARNAVMFGPPGHLYVYRSYGLHHCANVTCGPDGTGGGVLLRAVRVDEGAGVVRARRGDVPAARLSAGPGNVAEALGVTLADYGADLLDDASRVRLLPPPEGERVVLEGPRVGLRRASARPWRLWLDGERVSAYRAHPRADGEG